MAAKRTQLRDALDFTELHLPEDPAASREAWADHEYESEAVRLGRAVIPTRRDALAHQIAEAKALLKRYESDLRWRPEAHGMRVRIKRLEKRLAALD